jgi:hypothetical protein
MALGDVQVEPAYWPRRLAGRAAWRSRDADPAGDWPPSPCGAGGWAPPLPLRRGGQAPAAPVASVRQWPHRRWCEHACCMTVTLESTRSEHGTPGPRRRQARSPAADSSITPGCRPDERLSSRPRGAGWSEAVRGTGVPRAAEGAVERQTHAAKGAVERRTAPLVDWPHRLAGRAAWRRHCPSGEGARHAVRQWRRFGNGLTAALGSVSLN